MAYDISGRRIKFEVYSARDQFAYEYEIISGSVSDSARVSHYLPIGQSITNVIAHGRTVSFQFTGALLANNLPWYDLTPMMPVTELYVTANRTDPSITDPDEPEQVYHYSASAVVVSADHLFDTSSHQLFSLMILADGSYQAPFVPTS